MTDQELVTLTFEYERGYVEPGNLMRRANRLDCVRNLNARSFEIAPRSSDSVIGTGIDKSRPRKPGVAGLDGATVLDITTKREDVGELLAGLGDLITDVAAVRNLRLVKITFPDQTESVLPIGANPELVQQILDAHGGRRERGPEGARRAPSLAESSASTDIPSTAPDALAEGDINQEGRTEVAAVPASSSVFVGAVGRRLDSSTRASRAPESEARRVYPLCEAPPHTQPERAFELRVGIAEHSSPGLGLTPGFLVPDADFQLAIQVMADGFQVLGGDSMKLTLTATKEDPFPYKTLRLKPAPGVHGSQILGVVFMLDGSPIGMASRQIEVSSAPTVQGSGDESPVIAWTLPEDSAERPDLEIIVKPGSTEQRFEWYFRSRLEGIVHLPPQTQEVDDAQNFARTVVMKGIEGLAGKKGLAAYMRGVGKEIAGAIPQEVQSVLAQVAEQCRPNPPTVLLATTSLYVPWELAWMKSSWAGGKTRYLGAQAAIGRWVYTVGAAEPAPPRELSASSIAVITGRYTSNKLPEADKEALYLESDFGAESVPATFDAIEEVVRRPNCPDILHFAMHGMFDTTGSRDGLRLADEESADEYLGPYHVTGLERTDARLVFLNACEVAQAREDLTRFTGLIPAFLGIGVGAALAPWWKVNDKIAHELATRFYRAVLDDPGISPAEFLRAERASVAFDETGPLTSQLAYVYYGHPLLNLSWKGERTDSRLRAESAPADEPSIATRDA